MNYEKAYKEALERARDLHDNHPLGMPLTWMTCEKIFPELHESEDERIREALIKYLDALDDNEIRYGVSFKDMRTWLEKQEEPNTEDFGEFINELSKQFPEVSFAKLSRIAVRVKNWLEKQGEQKPIEQDTEIHDLWEYIKEWKDKFGRLPKDEDELAVCIDFVIKRQKSADKIGHATWSKEDEKMLDSIIDCIDGLCFIDSDQLNWLKSLKDKIQI